MKANSDLKIHYPGIYEPYFRKSQVFHVISLTPPPPSSSYTNLKANPAYSETELYLTLIFLLFFPPSHHPPTALMLQEITLEGMLELCPPLLPVFLREM